MSRIIGIDLGTTNTCLAVFEGSAPQVIPNRGGYKTTPSVVAFREDGELLVGQLAKRQAITNAGATVHAAKRLIGRRWGSPEVEALRKTLPYRLVPGPHQDVRGEVRGRVYPVPEIVSFILAEMKKQAEGFLGCEATRAVITVPAYFNDSQRQATRDAGRLAGLEVVRIINEPTAAAIAYGLDKKRTQRIAVYDLGGGTFDISILDLAEGVFEVLATGGDSFLGGEDFDARIIRQLLHGFAEEHGVDLAQDVMAMQRLKEAAETAKCELSTVREAEISLPFIHTRSAGGALHLQARLTRDELEAATEDLIDRTLVICKQVMDAAGMTPIDLDEVILVGGQTRMPRVQQAVEELFRRKPSKGVHPDEVVACGAAVQGGSLAGIGSNILLVDVTSHDLGLMIADGTMNVLVPRNSRIPCAQSRDFTTVRDSQTQMKIMVFQGENKFARDNELLGNFVLSNLRQPGTSQVKVRVTFEINPDGIVEVTARNIDTGEAAVIKVTASRSLTEQEIDEILQAREMARLNTSEEDLDRQATAATRILQEVEALLPTATAIIDGHPLARTALEKAEAVIWEGKAAITERASPRLDEALYGLELTLTLFRELCKLDAGQA